MRFLGFFFKRKMFVPGFFEISKRFGDSKYLKITTTPKSTEAIEYAGIRNEYAFAEEISY